MSRERIPIHKLSAKRRGGQAIVRYCGQRISLGPRDAKQDRPSDEAEAKLAKLKATWLAFWQRRPPGGTRGVTQTYTGEDIFTAAKVAQRCG